MSPHPLVQYSAPVGKQTSEDFEGFHRTNISIDDSWDSETSGHLKLVGM